MELTELNKYLSKLEGPGVIERLTVTEHSEGGSLGIKFCGDTGSLDDGEIELTFECVDILNLPLSWLMAPVQVKLADPAVLNDKIETNYQDDEYNLYIITDDVDIEWHVYAKSYEVKVLPVFYGR
ncbi:hypothetical protein ACUR5C_07945 [Aliikangiella sp. IMCC44653]